MGGCVNKWHEERESLRGNTYRLNSLCYTALDRRKWLGPDIIIFFFGERAYFQRTGSEIFRSLQTKVLVMKL